MAYRVPNGSLVHISSGLATAVNITALTNASEAVATATNTYTAGDIVLINSGWTGIDNRVAKVKAPSGTSFTLDSYDTTSTTIYPAGSGTGTAQKVSGWTQLGQIADSQSSGGDQQFTAVQFLESTIQVNLPTVKNPYTLKFTIADDPTQAGQILAAAADTDRAPRVIRITLPGTGGVIYMYAYVTMAPVPSLNVNQLMGVETTMSTLALPKRY